MAQPTTIDLFAGAGGASKGAVKAGFKVLWAANHNKHAVECHAKNHPGTIHACQDLRQANWRDVPDHDVMLASPCCQGHTRARGIERTHHDASRATAWACVDCVEVKQPKFIVIENVPEFRRWRHYPRWWGCLEEDYRLTENILDCADLGVPQNRVRLFIVGVHKKMSKTPVTINRARIPHTPVRSIINWNADGWSKVNDHVENTVMRVRQGREQFGKNPFLLAYYGNSRGGRSLDRPVGTLTTKDRYALIWGDWMRMLTVGECKLGMGFPADYWLPDAHSVSMKLLGNAVVPAVETYLLNQIRRFVPKWRAA